MRIHELIFQGVVGVERPCRLRPGGALGRVPLPGTLSHKDVQALLIACLYPTYLTEEISRGMGFDESTKLAIILESRQGHLRVIRRKDNLSVRLQQKSPGGYQDLASGASAVQTFLQERLGLPRIEVFLPLHLWQFDPDQLPERLEGAQYGDDPRIPELIESYLTSLEVESIEDRVQELEVRIREGQEALGQGVELEEKLERAKEKLATIQVQELSDEEVELISERDARLEEFQEQLDRLRSEEATEAELVRSLIPETPLRASLFWIGLIVALVAMGASFYRHESHRLLALFAIPGLGLAAFELLQYFDKMGRASVHQVRLNSIQRRIDQVLQADILYRDRIEHLILHAGVRDEQELQERIPMAAKLRRIITKLEERLEKVRLNPEYRAARLELTALQDELVALRSARKKLPDFIMNSYQLESDLKTLGVDPIAVREQEGAAGDQELSTEELGRTPFRWLQEVARWTGQWEGGELDETAKAMWAKICSHVLSDRFAEVELSPEGELIVGALTEEQRELWQRTRSSEVYIIQAALALALHINGQRRGANNDDLTSIWINDPGETMTAGHAAKFESIFLSAARDVQIGILGAGE